MNIKALTRHTPHFAGVWEAQKIRFESWLAKREEAEAGTLPLRVEGIWTIVGIFQALLLLRFFLHAFGIGYSAFTMPAYGLTSIVVAPFAVSYGILGSSFQEAYLDVPALIASAALFLLAWGITRFYFSLPLYGRSV